MKFKPGDRVVVLESEYSTGFIGYRAGSKYTFSKIYKDYSDFEPYCQFIELLDKYPRHNFPIKYIALDKEYYFNEKLQKMLDE